VVPGTQWSTTHFDEANFNCTIYDSTGKSYSATSTSSALQVFQQQNPDAIVDYTFLGVFGVDGTKDYHLDRIRLGTPYTYDYSKVYAVPTAA
jgi:hypothetical protein